MDGGRLPKGRNVVTLVACVPFLFEKQLAGGTRATPTAFLCRPYCSGNHGIDFNLKSSVSFPKQRCLSHAETQRRGDSANMWRFAARFSLHPFGEESILSFRFPNFARTCKMLLFSGLSLRSLRPQRLCVRTQTRNLGLTFPDSVFPLRSWFSANKKGRGARNAPRPESIAGCYFASSAGCSAVSAAATSSVLAGSSAAFGASATVTHCRRHICAASPRRRLSFTIRV